MMAFLEKRITVIDPDGNRREEFIPEDAIWTNICWGYLLPTKEQDTYRFSLEGRPLKYFGCGITSKN